MPNSRLGRSLFSVETAPTPIETNHRANAANANMANPPMGAKPVAPPVVAGGGETGSTVVAGGGTGATVAVAVWPGRFVGVGADVPVLLPLPALAQSFCVAGRTSSGWQVSVNHESMAWQHVYTY